MSGHSKWATTKHRKAAQDAKRSALFSKLSRNITVAAKEGGDPNPENNASLAAAIDKAKGYSLPKDKIMQSGIADELHVSSQPNTPTVNTAIKDEAVSALTMLGFSPAPSAKVVVSILAEQPDLPVEQVVKLALKMIK